MKEKDVINTSVSVNEIEPSPLVDLALYNVPEPTRKQPEWVMREPIVYSGANETLFHRRRTGGYLVDDEEQFAYEHSEDYVKKMKEFGIHIVLSSFEKNHIIEEEALEMKKRLAGFIHKYGLRMAVYIRADQVYREFLPHGPGGKDLFQKTADGRIPSYGFQEWRRYVCMHNPEVLESYKETIRRAIEEVGVDALHFDGVGFGGVEGGGACRCDKCRADFTDFLIRRYGNNPELARKRFGHTNLENIEPPGMIAFPAIPAGAITRPDWQEWISFRCTWTTMLLRDISEYIYKVNPEVAIIPNGCWPAVKENTALLFGWDADAYAGHADLVYMEDAYDPGITGDGLIIHRVRQMKMAHNAGTFLINYVDRGGLDEKGLWMHMAYDAAFNMGRISTICWEPRSDTDKLKGSAALKKRFLSWVEEHWDIYTDLETLSECTVWRSQRGLAFSGPLAYAAFVRMEQLLVEQRIPFEIATDRCLERLDRENVLIIPDVECITSGQARKIIDFVRSGGGLLIGKNTSLYDGWHRRRRSPLFKEIMKGKLEGPKAAAMKHIAHAGAPVEFESEAGFGKETQYFRSGKGRVVYIPSFVDPASQPPMFTPRGDVDFSLDYTNWRPPENAEEILAALGWLRRNRYRFKVDAPRGVIAEFYHQPTRKRNIVHLVNLDTRKVARNVVIRVNSTSRESIKAVEALSPDDPPPGELEWQADPLGATISIDEMRTYAVVVMSFGA